MPGRLPPRWPAGGDLTSDFAFPRVFFFFFCVSITNACISCSEKGNAHIKLSVGLEQFLRGRCSRCRACPGTRQAAGAAPCELQALCARPAPGLGSGAGRGCGRPRAGHGARSGAGSRLPGFAEAPWPGSRQRQGDADGGPAGFRSAHRLPQLSVPCRRARTGLQDGLRGATAARDPLPFWGSGEGRSRTRLSGGRPGPPRA